MNFTSAEEVYAIVKEELNSYFSSGVVSDLMFPKWTQREMGKFTKSALPIKNIVIPLNNFVGELPDDFDSVKELWVCGYAGSETLRNPSSLYYQTDCRITEINDKCNECFENGNQTCNCHQGYPDKNERYRVMHKVTGVTQFDFWRSYLLRPGNRNALDKCHSKCLNIAADSQDTFDIQDCQIMTSFREGMLNLTYYSTNISEDGDLLIPDNDFLKDYLTKYLRYKVFEMVLNTPSDEGYQVLSNKMDRAKQDYMDAKVSAQVEFRKWDQYQIGDQIRKRKNRFSYYRRSLR